MEMDEREVMIFEDEDGSEFEMDVIDYFEHDGETYAILVGMNDEDVDEADEDDEDEDDDSLFESVFHVIMKVVGEGEDADFVAPEEDKFEILAAIAEERLNAFYGAECGDGECECGCCCHEEE